MSIYVGGEKAKLYRGDYGPAQLYKGDVKIAGYTDGEKVGTAISGGDTYNDALNPAIEGKSEQTVTVQGKNLFDPKCFVSEINASLPSAAMVKDWQGVPCVSYPCAVSNLRFMQHQFKANTQYTISGEVGFDRTQEAQIEFMALCYTDGTYRPVWIINVVSGVFSEFRFTTAANKTVDYIVVNSYSPGLISNIKIASLQLEEGTTATPYEPFVPNSPSPDYPSPIRSSENFDVVSCGRNLMGQERWYKYLRGIDPSSVTIKSNLSHTNYISMWCPVYGSVSRFMRGEFLDRTQYTLSYWYKLETPLQESIPYHTGIRIQYTDGTNSYGLVDYAHKTTQWVYVTLISNVDKTIDYLFFLNSSSCSPWSGFADFQIEEGTTATPYQPYHATTAHITDPLRSVGDVADSIEVSEGKVEVVRRCRVEAFDGSEDWNQYPSSLGKKYMCFMGETPGKIVGPLFCTHDIQTLKSTIYGDELGIWAHSQQIYAYYVYWGIEYRAIGTTPASTKAENNSAFKAWLSAQASAGTPVIMQYQLSTPTRTDITATPLGQALLALRTYPHYTQVYTNATLPPTLRAKIKEMEL